MDDISRCIKDVLYLHGADIVGFGDLTKLPKDVRCGMPTGVSIAVKYPKEVIRGISELPTSDYYDYYNRLNEKLDMLATLGADTIKQYGYEAIAQTRAYVEQSETDYSTKLPHKTVATRAGVGWIGKSALLVTKQFGSMIRLSSILTNAPLKTAKPINKSLCGSCTACTDTCPAGAISGKLWAVGVDRDAFYNAAACRTTARERALQGFGIETTVCGKCIAVCPYTKHYLNGED